MKSNSSKALSPPSSGLEPSRLDHDGDREVRRGRGRPRLAPVEGGLLSRAALAKAMKVNARTIFKWQGQGMPVRQCPGPGHPSRYALQDVRAWWAARARTHEMKYAALELAKTRQAEADAELKLQLLRTRAKDLLPRVEVEKRWSAEVARVRSKLLACPVAYAERVAKAEQGGVGAVEHALMSMLREVLTELAEPEAGAG